MEQGRGDGSTNGLIMLRLASMGRDAAAFWQHPGDSAALWGAETCQRGGRGASITAAAAAEGSSWQGLQARSIKPPPNTTPEGVINHLAPDSKQRGEERSHLGWSQRLLYGKTFTS